MGKKRKMKIAILNRKERLLYTYDFHNRELINMFTYVTGIRKENFEEMRQRAPYKQLSPDVYSVLHKGVTIGGIFGIDHVVELW